jgi:hypothetical protein
VGGAGDLPGPARGGPAASAATAGAKPPAARHATTVTEDVATSAGTVTLRVRYAGGLGSSLRLTSVRYSGRAHPGVRHAVLVFSVGSGLLARPAQLKQHAELQVKPAPASRFVFIIRLGKGTVRRFSGAVPAKVLARVSKHLRLMPGEVLTGVLGSMVTIKPAARAAGKGPSVIEIVLPAGVVLFP